jgi:hypothetical protein
MFTVKKGDTTCLTTVNSAFHAEVIKARLAAEGINCFAKGPYSSVHPLFSNIEIWVREEDIALCQEILLADAVDALFLPETPKNKSSAIERNFLITGILIFCLIVTLYYLG